MTEEDVTEVLAYLRVSTERQGRSGLGEDAQRAMIEEEANRRGWQVVEWITDTASGKSVNRPGIQRALALMEDGGPKVLVAAKLDRISRSALDFLTLVERAQENGWKVVVLQPNIDMTDPFGKAVAGILAVIAQLEREMAAERTRDALQALKRQGWRLGKGSGVPPEVADRIVEDRAGGMTLRQIADELTHDGIPTASGRSRWYASSVQQVLTSAELDREAPRGRRVAKEKVA